MKLLFGLIGISIAAAVGVVPVFYPACKRDGLQGRTSGLAVSREHPGIVYTFSNQDDVARVYVFDASRGIFKATFTVEGTSISRSWEEAAIGPCGSGQNDNSCIYIGDIRGDGTDILSTIYRIKEPENLNDQTINVGTADILKFTWDRKDIVALMVGPDSSLFVLADDKGIAKLENSDFGGDTVDVSSTAMVNIDSSDLDPLSGDISPDGKKVLLKAGSTIYYWNTGESSDYLSVLANPGSSMTYRDEPEGAIIRWEASGQGHYIEGAGGTLFRYIQLIYLPTCDAFPVVPVS